MRCSLSFLILLLVTGTYKLICALSLDKQTYRDGDLKLIDGPAPTMGTVLVYRGYGWGRICDDHWTMREAQVVCRQLGMGHALEAHRRNRYASNVAANYLMDEVHCTGREERLTDCRFSDWGVHDCKQNEEVGVKCSYEAPIKFRPAWNPLNLDHNRTFLKNLSKMPQHHTEMDRNNSIAIIGHCYGNETNLDQCQTYASPDGVSCKSNLAAAVECVKDLPDLVPDIYSLETSSYLQQMSLWLLECALEENCLPDTVYQIIDRNPGNYVWMTRTLMRFSSIIENQGTAPFRPLEEPENWEWHACHMHYHSMKVFSRYEVIDPDQRLLAVGLKASFCLEDNVCQSGVNPVFRCSNVIDSKGTQGISPGCRDMYLHDYDCQWVDITDIAPGKYKFQVSFNPDFLVPESNYFNNALTCELTHMGHSAVLRSCRYSHPNDLV